jgi:hypothetical protein
MYHNILFSLVDFDFFSALSQPSHSVSARTLRFNLFFPKDGFFSPKSRVFKFVRTRLKQGVENEKWGGRGRAKEVLLYSRLH